MSFSFSKRNIIYISLLMFVSLGMAVDLIFWPTAMSSGTINDVIQIIGILLLCLYWEKADSEELEVSLSRGARISTLVLPLLGTAVYLFQTRRWYKAVLVYCLFWAGVLLSATATALIVGTLVDTGTFNPT
ncbi:MAG: hypothetical protein AAGJ51_11145 [Pseudomonadota bacterium]